MILSKGKYASSICWSFIEEGTNAMNMDESMVVQCLDFQKTFDKGPHQRPLQKIKPYGI